MRNGYTFYKSFNKAIKYQPNNIQNKTYPVIKEYDQYKTDTENLKPITCNIFTRIKFNIENALSKQLIF